MDALWDPANIIWCIDVGSASGANHAPQRNVGLLISSIFEHSVVLLRFTLLAVLLLVRFDSFSFSTTR